MKVRIIDMFKVRQKSIRTWLAIAAMLTLLATPWAFADKKKKKADQPAAQVPTDPFANIDTSHLVWPQPPAIPRIKWLDYFSAEKPAPVAVQTQKPKKSWMDRMAGVSADTQKGPQKTRFFLGTPYGLAVDSKGMLYVADTKVGAVFVFNPENKDTDMLKHGVDAKFGQIFGLVIDDADRLFVSDGAYNHVLVFNAKHKLESQFGEGIMNDPAGLAIDTNNRFLYVANTGADQVLVYDADTFKLLRKIGTTGKDHTLTTPGDFSKPTNVAVDKDGNLFVSDTLNDRVEEFDADGVFVRTWGKNGDAPGDFARPKGIAVDADGHVWVADASLNRLQVFTQDGHLLLALGQFGYLPGQFQALACVTIDKYNRVFTSEQYLGRVQMFRYSTDTEARAELERRKAKAEGAKTTDDKKPAGNARPPATTAPDSKPAPQAAAQPAPATVKAQ
jgi:DNA-binding beta-propeller fold protein YncE